MFYSKLKILIIVFEIILRRNKTLYNDNNIHPVSAEWSRGSLRAGSAGAPIAAAWIGHLGPGKRARPFIDRLTIYIHTYIHTYKKLIQKHGYLPTYTHTDHTWMMYLSLYIHYISIHTYIHGSKSTLFVPKSTGGNFSKRTSVLIDLDTFMTTSIQKFMFRRRKSNSAARYRAST